MIANIELSGAVTLGKGDGYDSPIRNVPGLVLSWVLGMDLLAEQYLWVFVSFCFSPIAFWGVECLEYSWEVLPWELLTLLISTVPIRSL